MISRWVRTWYGQLLARPLLVLGQLGVTPDALTIGGLLAHIGVGLLLALNYMTWGMLGLLAGQLLDTLDGELARRCLGESAFGGFLDSVCDHLGDFAVYMGLLWHLQGVGSRIDVILIAAALFGSVFGSHVRSRASMAGIDTKRVGLFTRFERTLVLALGILLNQLTIALWILAIFNNFSALQRMVYALRAAHIKSGPAQG